MNSDHQHQTPDYSDLESGQSDISSDESSDDETYIRRLKISVRRKLAEFHQSCQQDPNERARLIQAGAIEYLLEIAQLEEFQEESMLLLVTLFVDSDQYYEDYLQSHVGKVVPVVLGMVLDPTPNQLILSKVVYLLTIMTNTKVRYDHLIECTSNQDISLESLLVCKRLTQFLTEMNTFLALDIGRLIKQIIKFSDNQEASEYLCFDALPLIEHKEETEQKARERKQFKWDQVNYCSLIKAILMLLAFVMFYLWFWTNKVEEEESVDMEWIPYEN